MASLSPLARRTAGDGERRKLAGDDRLETQIVVISARFIDTNLRVRSDPLRRHRRHQWELHGRRPIEALT